MLRRRSLYRFLLLDTILIALFWIISSPLYSQTDLPDFSGIIRDVSHSGGTFSLLGRTFYVTDSTIFYEEFDHQQIPLEQVRPGWMAQVWGEVDSLDNYLPSFVFLFSDNRMIGPINDITDNSFSLHGVEFTLAQLFECNLGHLLRRPYDWELLESGDAVATSWIEREGEKITGNVVVMLPPGNLVVPVQDVDPEASCVTAGDVAIQVTDWARITDVHGTPLELGELQAGDWIEVNFAEQFAGDSLITEEVVVHDEAQPLWEFGGSLQALDEVDSTLTILGRSLKVGPTTEFYDYSQNPLSLDELQEDDWLFCSALPGEDSSLTVASGFRMEGFANYFEIKELIRDIDHTERTIQVGDLQVTYTDFTRFMLKDVGEISVSHLVPRINIVARGWMNQGSREAVSVDVEPNCAVANQEIEGIELEDSVLTVSAHPVKVLPPALIQITGDGLPRVIPLSDLQAGQKPYVQGYLIPPDTLAALMVTLFAGPTSIDTFDDLSAPHPRTSELFQNYPNPFNPVTTIEFAISDQHSRTGENEAMGQEKIPVRLDVYDIRGRLVRVLLDCPVTPGIHKVVWEGEDMRGVPVASGVYLYRFQCGESCSLRKMVLRK